MKARSIFPLLSFLPLFLAACTSSGPRPLRNGARDAVVTGTVAYRERIALPPDAIMEVRLLEVSHQDSAAPVIAETTVLSQGRQVPIPFELRYEPARIDPGRSYGIRATITAAGGMMFTTTAAYAVITQGNPTHADLVLERASSRPRS